MEGKISALRNTEVIKLIKKGKTRGERSEVMMTVINSLVSTGFTDAEILLIFERYPIGEKFLEKGQSKNEWLQTQINKAKEFTKTTSDYSLITFTAAELQKINIPPLEWLIPDILPVGLTLLAAPPKAGKTRLASQFALNLTLGLPIFNHLPVKSHGVLFLCLEDSQRRIKERFEQMLPADSLFPDTLHLATELPVKNLEPLRQWIQIHDQIKLVIIDVYGRIKSPRKSSDIYQTDYDEMCGIKAIADEFSIGIILIHHTNKNSLTTNIHEKVSGSNAITGACDTLMSLERHYDRQGRAAQLCTLRAGTWKTRN
ncbi:MAG: AAA family ATPase [Desulfuromusa sp.]|nr:AAA family ATPase [Desulfuromusa sp.]